MQMVKLILEVQLLHCETMAVNEAAEITKQIIKTNKLKRKG